MAAAAQRPDRCRGPGLAGTGKWNWSPCQFTPWWSLPSADADWPEGQSHHPSQNPARFACIHAAARYAWGMALGSTTRAPAKADQRRRCVYCGYAGMAIQLGAETVACPSCGGDLYSRPPRTYLEMEGFVPPEPPRPLTGWRRLLVKVLRAWCAVRGLLRGTREPNRESAPGPAANPRPARVHAPRSRRSRPSVNDEG